MADVPKNPYRRYVEVSEATFQALLKNHSAGEAQHYKPIPNFSGFRLIIAFSTGLMRDLLSVENDLLRLHEHREASSYQHTS
jgi:hypothetical protein